MRLLLLATIPTALLGLSPYYDIVVYGATPAGITAAISAARLNSSVLLVEPSSHVGGMLAAGMLDDSGDHDTG
jgi:flavin-dependent dehydrogenase